MTVRMLKAPALAVSVAFLVGCGEDGGSSSAPSNADQNVATYEDLTLCTANREGASAYVRDEKTEYVCSGGNWIPASDASSSQGGSSASSGGGTDGSSSSGEIDSTAYEGVPVVAVKNKTISGSAQKGPFVNGASVTVQELDGETLAQTGKSFKGKITGDKGEFSVSSVTLASQYALLEATGYYMNENTGAKSNGMITLNALVDLSKHENVNINLLTHLEYERALYLVGTGMNVPAAKKQAEKEIFEAFGITGDFANSEELNILSTSEGDAALLAISALMQGSLTEAELSERLANFANDIEKDGKWDDATTKAAMADWASGADLANIGDNVKKWTSSSKTPEFEPIVKNFWWNNYGLGECLATNAGAIKRDTNLRSNWNDTLFVCDAIINNWRIATPFDVPNELYLNPNIPYGTMVDDRDDQTYKTVVIGTQIWMAENLNYDYKIGGESYGNGCYEYCAIGGRYYTWAAAMDSATTSCGSGKECAADTGRVQGVCPNGWHLPDTAEWNVLFATVGGQSTAGMALKSATLNFGGTDAFGFSARPNGVDSISNPDRPSFYANFWTSSKAALVEFPSDRDRVHAVVLRSDSTAAFSAYWYLKDWPTSVRCVKD